MRIKISEIKFDKNQPRRTIDQKSVENLAKSMKVEGKMPKNFKEAQKKAWEANKLKVGKLNLAWKGNKVKYIGLHAWVEHWKGKPDTCETCGRSGLKGKRIVWANRSGKYKRDLSDWIRLCAKCHRKFDGLYGEAWSKKIKEAWRVKLNKIL